MCTKGKQCPDFGWQLMMTIVVVAIGYWMCGLAGQRRCDAAVCQ
jgi:hypothetical protein